jgi:two-component system, cell cycle sensor histidine kinase and response regulator CckA
MSKLGLTFGLAWVNTTRQGASAGRRDSPVSRGARLSNPELTLDRALWLAEILAHSPAVIAVVSTQGQLLYINRVAPASSVAEVVGQDVTKFLEPRARIAWRSTLARVLRANAPEDVAVESIDGKFWNVRMVPIRDGGETVAMLALAEDVTASKRDDAERARNEAALDLALESSGMGLWRWNVGADTVVWDKAAKQLFEWPLREEHITYADFLSRLLPEDRGRVAEHISIALQTGVYDDLECRVALPGNRTRHVLIKGRVLRGDDGWVTDLLGGVVDVTRKRELELQISRLQKIEAIGHLAGGIAHDFNNLLLAVLGNVGLAERSTSAEERAQFHEEIRHAANRAAELTQRLLTIGRRQQIQESVFDFGELLEETARLLRRLLPEHIEFQIPPRRNLPRVVGDRTQIEQVVMNLCLNARDAMPAGGRLVLGVDLVESAPSPDKLGILPDCGRLLLLTVSDTGAGIAPEHFERLFEPFFTTKPQGTGLGLATAWGAVKRHGGHISVDSNVGHGTTFRVYLPVSDRGPETVSSAGSPRPSGGSETLLVADDQPEVRSILLRILSTAGYRVHVAQDGIDALEKFRQHAAEIRCVLLDAVMPRLDGVDALLEIRKLRPQLPAIISSGYSDQMPALVSLEGVRFLPKPYELDLLLATVRAALDASLEAQSSVPAAATRSL